ncbi:MAG: hypothetical protein QM483_00755 [Desulfuromusa sp.]
MNRVAIWFLVISVAFCMVADAHAQEGFRAWVGLYDPADLGWLENENRLGKLCSDPSTLAECHAQCLSPRVSFYELRSLSSESSDRIGDLIVVATPGRGLSGHFRAAGSVESIRFTPDLFLQDWGYGPYFHQTLSEERGDWIRLPPDPWATEVWLSRETDGSFPIVEIQNGDIIEMGDRSWYVVAADRDFLLLRPEQSGDHWCEEGEPPEIEATEPTRFSRAQLVDSSGHILFRLKYLKGC